ncbi:MAG: MotA/TolQ/ExbB proton channel family protein [Candidatus Zixiibacteriota bacterium]|jgi:biopolymer transport protein ExbB
MRKIILTIFFVLFVVYLAWWVTWFFIMGKNLSFVFDTMASIGGAERMEENVYNTENANVLGKGGAVVARGGGLVDMLFFLLLLTTFYIVERATAYRSAKGKYNHIRLMGMIKEHLKKGDIPGAIKACDDQKGVVGRILKAGLEKYGLVKGQYDAATMRAEIQQSISETNAMEASLLERNLIFIATIASIGTMTGLLGTVIGMIRAFAALAAKGRPDPNKLATGISEALINTAGGLTVAIISIVAYNFYLNKIDKFNFTFEESSNELLTLLVTKED